MFGINPPCETCQRPTLRPGNVLAWEIYKTICNQFSHDFAVDIFEVMKIFGVKNPVRMLRKLAVIHGIARDNAERLFKHRQNTGAT